MAPGAVVVQVVRELAPLLELAGLEARVSPLEDRHALLRASREVRRLRPRRAVLLTPSFSAALLARLGGVPERRGTATDARGWLLTEAVDRAPLLDGHRVLEYLRLVDPGWDAPEPPAPDLGLPEAAREAWEAAAGRAGLAPEAAPTGPARLGLLPGSAAPSRRWPAGRFAALARRRIDAGEEVVVFGVEREADLTRRIAGEAPGAADLGGRTDLAALAGGLASCAAVVANDTGPMHLAAALGRPLVGIFGAGDPAQTRPLTARAEVVRRADLPCVPCLENRCPRRGRGFELPRARIECLRLITVDAVEEALMRVRGERPGEDAGGGGR
ncbi:MAG TPA: glycosyltransferase family 9 protein [Gemmatimonadota bacterium]|nr:glycosyltransferase family 9 protein [Gemmatimonadota bacterium]